MSRLISKSRAISNRLHGSTRLWDLVGGDYSTNLSTVCLLTDVLASFSSKQTGSTAVRKHLYSAPLRKLLGGTQVSRAIHRAYMEVYRLLQPASLCSSCM